MQVSVRLVIGGAKCSDFPSQDAGPQRSSVRFSPSARFFLLHFIDVSAQACLCAKNLNEASLSFYSR